MTRNPPSPQTAYFGGLPHRWRCASRQLLSGLVFAAALVQFVPVGWTSSPAVTGANPDAVVNDSLSVNTHSLKRWAIPPTTAARAIDEQPNALKSFDSGSASATGDLASQGVRLHCQRHGSRAGHLHWLATLVNLNVRLQV